MPMLPKNLDRHALNMAIDTGRLQDPKFHAEFVRARRIAEEKAGKWAHATPEDVMIEWRKRRLAASLYATPKLKQFRKMLLSKKITPLKRRETLLEYYRGTREVIDWFRRMGKFEQIGVTDAEVRALTNSVLLGLVPKKAKAKGNDITIGEIEEAIRLGERDIQLE